MDMIEDAIAPDSYSGQYLNTTMELLFIHLLRNHIEDFSHGRGSAKAQPANFQLTGLRFSQSEN